MCKVPTLFKVWLLLKLEKLMSLWVLQFVAIYVVRVLLGLQVEFLLIMYLKHDNVVHYESFECNVVHSNLCDNVMFTVS